MLLALIYTSVPAFIFGRMELQLTPQLHDKILFADAKIAKQQRETV